jgi:hypothetical protein
VNNSNLPFIEPQLAAFTSRSSRASAAADFDHNAAPAQFQPPPPRGSLQPESIGARVSLSNPEQHLVKVRFFSCFQID